MKTQGFSSKATEGGRTFGWVMLLCLCTGMAGWGWAQGHAAPAVSKTRPWMDSSLPPEQRANLLIHSMTLDEKILMMHGAQRKKGSPPPPANAEPTPKGYVGYVPPIRRLGIPALRLADGRAGVGNDARDVTLLPAPIAAASSWDLDL